MNSTDTPTNMYTDRLDPKQRQRLGEIIRFGIVGAAATLLQYEIGRAHV